MSENSESDHYNILGEAIKCLILSNQKAKPPNYSIYYKRKTKKETISHIWKPQPLHVCIFIWRNLIEYQNSCWLKLNSTLQFTESWLLMADHKTTTVNLPRVPPDFERHNAK